MTNRSVFPNAVDSFNLHYEILASDIPNIQRYQTLIMQTIRTAAEEDELTNLKTTLKDKLFSSEDLNKIQDCMTNLESFFLTDTVAYLNTLDVGLLRTDLGTPANLTTTDKTNTVNAINEVKAEANTNTTNIANHTNNTGNPHNTTAAQVNAYTTSQVDTKITALDVNPYFRLVVGGTQQYNTTNADQQITFGSSQLANTSGFTAVSNTVTCNVDGMYKIHAAMQLSGLNSNMLGTVKFNVTINGTTTTYFRTIRGATGWDGANGGGVWIENDELIALPVGATIQFYANINESPRTIMGLVVTAFKVSKNTVGV